MNTRAIKAWSLKSRVTLLMLALFAGSIWSLAYYISRTLRADIQTALGQQQFSMATFIAAEFDRELRARLSALEKVAEEITPIDMRDPVALQTCLEQRSVLQLLFNGGYDIVRPDGVVIADVPVTSGRMGGSYIGDEWISAALKQARSSISRPLMGPALHAPVLVLTVPIIGPQGGIIGALNGVVNLAKPTFLDEITDGTYGETGGYVLVAAEDRRIITASDKSRVMESLPAPGVNPYVDRNIGGFEGFDIVVNAHGEEILGSIKHIPAANWYVGVSLPTAEAFAPIRKMQQRVVLATALLTLLVAALTWWILKRQLSPMTAAARALAAMSNSALPMRPLPITSQDEIGELIGGFNRVVESLKQREEVLRESEEKFRVLFEQAGDYAFILASQGEGGPVIIDANESACQAHGYSRDELIGRSVQELETDSITSEELAERRTRLLAGEVLKFETIHRRKDGSTFPIEVMSKAVRIGDRSPFILSVERDITERKYLERARLNSQRMESLGTLAGGIAHDFNNILAAIQGNADLAVEELGSAGPAAESLSEIRKATSRAAELVRRIMAFGRPKEPQQGVIDLRLVVEEVLKLLRSTIPASIALQTRFPSSVPPVQADASQVHEALINLTTNAAHAIGSSAGSIEYQLKSVEVVAEQAERLGLAAGPHAVLTVKDNGSGMDEETQARIFDAFFTTKPAGEGSGLGLSVVYGIMKGHGGAVSVDSRTGMGSCFQLYFPVARGIAGQALQRDQDAVREGPSVGQRVMYVDDEEALVSLARRALVKCGHSVEGFTDPRAALEKFRSHPNNYDIVVTDLAMPHISGLEFTRELLGVRPETPVIMTTGNVRPEDEALALRLGIRQLIPKPLTQDELADAINRLSAKGQASS